ncbi:MAG: ATP-binding protein [Planctomycetota bacterium]
MLSHWPIRTKLSLGLGLLALMVLALFGSAYYGLYAYRSLLRSLAARSSELPLASRARSEVENLRNTLSQAYERFSLFDEIGVVGYIINDAENLGIESAGIEAQEGLMEAEESLRSFLGALEEYRAQLDRNRLEADARLGDDQRERETLARIDQVVGRLQGESAASTLGEAWLLDRSQIRSLLAEVTTLSQLVAELPGHFHVRLQELQGDVRSRYRTAIVIAWVTAGLSIILLTASTRVFYQWFAQPLEQLVRGSRAVAAGNFDHRIQLKTHDEMRELADAMNAMTERFCEIRNDLDLQVRERTNQVVRSEQLASVGFLAAGVSHEINNPLASIALCGESLEIRLQELLDSVGQSHAEDVEVAKNYLKMIQREAFRCKQITEKLLDFARRGDTQRSATDLRELAAGVVEMIQHLGRYQDRKLILEAGPPIIAAVNAQEMKQVVLNLITNGLESLDADGVVNVSVQRVDEAVCIAVEDNGCGMTPEVMKHLYEPFYTRRRNGQGTGLGLSITHRIVEEHDGRIEATSEGAGKGSRFVVLLPAVEAAKEVNHRYQAA